MTRTEILNAAINIVEGERQQQYGAPEDSFALISKFWSDYLDCVIDSTDVAVMMILLKVARIAGGSGKDDNWIDICGYAACGGAISKSDLYDGSGIFTEVVNNIKNAIISSTNRKDKK